MIRLVNKDKVGFVNGYFLQYYKWVGDCIQEPKLPIEKTWTPKRRLTSIS